jgi:hypothetical protein
MRLASPSMRTLPEPFSYCDSERIKVLSLSRMDDLSSHSKASFEWRHNTRCTILRVREG